VVAVSGVASAWVRVSTFENLFTAYGLIVVLKSAVLVLLGPFGAFYRLRIFKEKPTRVTSQL
jgi:putative copper resistance protein D